VAKLARAEQAVEKYQKKLEEMVELKKQNKDLCERMDQYLDQIHSLESAAKGMTTLNKMVEQYKNRAVELETEKFEAQSCVQMRDQQVAQLKAELDKAKEGRRVAQDEAAGLRMQLEQQLEAAAALEDGLGSPSKGGAGLEDAFQTETMPMLREKVKRLERELRMAQAGVSAEGAAAATGAAEAAAVASTAAAHEVAIMQQELDDVRQQKKQREEALLAVKKQLSEAQYELTKAQVRRARCRAICACYEADARFLNIVHRTPHRRASATQTRPRS
jgi:chromosome segregation ATPase